MADAQSDIFIQDLEAEFGDTGYAFWFKTLELIASQGEEGILDISENVWRRVIHSRRTDHLRRLYTFCTQRNKFQVEPLSNGLLRIKCDNFVKYADNYTRYGKELQSNFKDSSKNVDANRKEEEKKKNIYTVDHFLILWKQYPNRQGKKDAKRHFLASVKTADDWNNINIALKNYLASGNVVNDFIKNGSTWFNQWEDWVTPTPSMIRGNNSGQQKKTAQSITRTYAEPPK